MHKYTSLAVRLTQEQGAIKYPCTSTDHFLETGNKSLSQFSSMDMVTSQQKRKSKIMCSCTPDWKLETLQKQVFQVTDTREYIILGNITAQQTGYIHFPRITPPRLMQLPRTHAHLKVITVKTPKQKETSRMGQDLRHPNIQLLDGAVLINGKKHNIPITKEYIFKGYSDVFSRLGTSPRGEYHIKQKKDYELIQHPPRPVPVKLKPAYKQKLEQSYSECIITPVGNTLNGLIPYFQ